MKPSKPDPGNGPDSAPDGAAEHGRVGRPPEDENRWFRSVVENSSEVVSIVDPDGTLRYANPAWRRVLGYDPDEVLGKNVLDQVHPDDLHLVLEATEEALSEGGVVTNKAEYRRRHKDGSWRWVESIGTYLLDDPYVRGVVVTVRDVTERKEAEEALRESEAEIFAIFESITDAFFALDREWRFAYVNGQAEALFGRTREDLVGERIQEDPKFYPEYLKAVAEGRTARFEGYCPPSGAWYSVRAYPSKTGLSVYLQDITERKRAEERIHFQSRLLDAVGQAVVATDPDGRVLYWNRGAEQLYGWSADEVMGCPVEDFGVPEDLRSRTAGIMGGLRAGRSWSGEITVLRKGGGSVRVIAADTPVYDERGDLLGIIGVSTDITELKATEEALRSSEERFRSLVQNASDIITVLEADGTVRYISPAVEKVTGYRAEEREGTNAFDAVHPEDRERALGLFAEIFRTPGVHPPLEFRVPHKDGTWRYLEHIVNNLLDDPSLNGVVVTSRDVTGRRAAEEALLEGERRLKAIVGNVPVVLFALDREGVFTLSEGKGLRALGLRPGEVVGRSVFEVYRDTPEILGQVRRALEGEEVSATVNLGEAAFEAFYGPLLDEGGEVVGLIGVAADVTGRERAEERLRRAEERYRSLVERAPAVVYIQEIGSPDSAMYMSPRIEDLTGYTPEECRDPELRWRMVHPDDRERMRQGDERPGRPGEVFTDEYRVLHRDGRAVWVRNESVLVEDEVSGTRYWQGFMLDITERKQAEEALRRLARRNTLILDSAGEGIYGLDREGRTTFANRAAASLTGYEAEELVGRDQHDLVHHTRADGTPYPREECPIHAAPTGGRVRRASDEVFWRKDGTSFPVEYTSTPITEGGEVVGTVVTFTDATERRAAEEALRESERRFRALTQNSSDVVTLLSTTGIVRYQSPSIEHVLGYRPEEMVGDAIVDYVHTDDRERVEMAFAEGLADPARRPSVEHRFRHKGGSWVWLESVGTNLLGDPDVGGYVANSRDVTERRTAEEDLARQAALLEQTHDAVFTRELGGKIVYWNEGAQRLYGWSKEEALGRVSHDLLGTVYPVPLQEIVRTLQREGRWEGELVHHARDGRQVVVGSRQVVAPPEGAQVFVLETNRDITERKLLEGRLEHQAFHDPLTGLPNRHLFLDRLGRALERTRRRKGRKVAVLFLDLDGFKVVNDSLGHAVGDLLLTVVAQRFGRCLRPEDTLARFGGDEFVVLVEDIEDPGDAVRVAERITGELRRPFAVEGRELFVAVSIGIALGEARTKGPEDLVRDADTAMYRAKEEGSTGYSLFSPAMYEEVLSRLELENDMRRAIERDEFVVHYQPIVRLEDRTVRGFEALVRWEHPERGLLDPDEFVPVAEESGLVVPVGELVLREACLRAGEWQKAHPRTPPLVMYVNLSARQLRRPDLVERVAGALREAGPERGTLTLDITETDYVRALEANTGDLDRLREMGVGISIDDFGTGYSSLSYLKRLPADAIKIDRSFVEGLGDAAEDTAIVRTILDLAHTLGREVIAEGVESEEQARLLGEMGCSMAQGYYFAKPLPPEDVAGFLAG